MSKPFGEKLKDVDGRVMVGGVGLASLEAMFNMVNTQSLISAGMVRDFEMSRPMQVQGLASALGQLVKLDTET